MQSVLWSFILSVLRRISLFYQRQIVGKKQNNALHLSAPCWPGREAPRWSDGRRLALSELPGAASSKVNRAPHPESRSVCSVWLRRKLRGVCFVFLFFFNRGIFYCDIFGEKEREGERGRARGRRRGMWWQGWSPPSGVTWGQGEPCVCVCVLFYSVYLGKYFYLIQFAGELLVLLRQQHSLPLVLLFVLGLKLFPLALAGRTEKKMKWHQRDDELLCQASWQAFLCQLFQVEKGKGGA